MSMSLIVILLGIGYLIFTINKKKKEFSCSRYFAVCRHRFIVYPLFFRRECHRKYDL